MNAPLRRVAISVLVLFTLLILNVNYIQVVRADKLRNDPGNTRELTAEYGRARGSIVVDGAEIAKSVPTDDQLKYLRQYPNGPVYAPVSGYYSLVYGNSALERSENAVLSGSDPRLFVRHIADLFTGRDPSGGDVVLTVDGKTQQTAMTALQSGNATGAVVALDPSTGKVLALASTPTYDPNQLSSHDPKAIRAYGAQLAAQDPDPRTNQAISERYSPGSVFKVIVSAAALSTGSYTPQTAVPAPDALPLPGSSRSLHNYNGESCNGGADQPLIDALTISCNTAFAQLGMTLGQDKVTSMAKAFGLDDAGFTTPLPVAPSTMGQIQDQAQLATASIGQQNVQITPMQGAMIAAAVANGGKLMKPYLVDQVRAPDLTVIDQTDPTVMSRPISSDVAAQLTQMMTSVVAKGTGKKAQISGIQVAGKTGTAQTDPESQDNSWFVGFAPADNPKIAVAVFIKHGGKTGGDISAPIAKQVMQAYLQGQGGLMALSTGSLLAGRYEITAPVAVGGMGEVWQARDRVLGRTVAAKVLKSEFTGDPNFLARFRNEARHTAALSHPNIASVYDYGETLDEYGRTVAYLVMEFVEGQPLVTILHEEGRLPVDWTLHVLGQAADGLSAAHAAGVVHRDIKPGNLIVRPDGVVKLTDFGIAQARDAAPLTRTGMVVGTAQYLSPEQAQGLELTASSDVYSLGVVGYECLAGVRPFDGTSQVAIALAHINRPPPLPADVPGPVQQLIGRALAKDAAQRFTDGGNFADAVHRVAAGGSLPAGPETGAVAAATEVLSAVDPTGTQVIPDTGTGGSAVPASTGPTRAPRPMPPLQAPPVDEPLPGYDDEPGRRAPRWPWLVGALVLLVALAGVGYLLLAGSHHTGRTARQSTTTSSASTSSGVATVTVDTAAFIGQDAAAVQARLTQEGLTVTRSDATAAELRAAGRALRAGAVAGSTHAGETVPVGTPVVLYVARSAYAPGTTAATSTTTAGTTAPASTTATRTTTSSPATTSTTPAAPTTTTPAPPPTAGGTSLTTTSDTNAGGNGAAPPANDNVQPVANGAPVNGATQ